MVTLADRIGAAGPLPGPEASRLVRRVHELFEVPLDALTAEDLRLLLRQRVAPAVLLPYAVAELCRDPWASGDMADGALLAAVLAVPEAGWPGGSADRLRERLERPDVRAVLDGSGPVDRWDRPADDTDDLPDIDLPDVDEALRQAVAAFLGLPTSVQP